MKLEPTKMKNQILKLNSKYFQSGTTFLEILIPKINPDHPDQLILYDALGSILIQTCLDKMRTLIPIEHLVNGIYFIRAYSKKMNRFIVKWILKVE